jgi:hypothetical protein
MDNVHSIMIAQIPDIVFLHGEAMNLYSNPLEPYWSNNRKKRPPFVPSVECVRGYVATWEIADGQLLLKEIQGSYKKLTLFLRKKRAAYSMKRLFPRGDRVKATWFSGRLRIPFGRMILFEDNGYDSRFEKEIIVTVEDGTVTRMVTLDNVNRTVVLS